MTIARMARVYVNLRRVSAVRVVRPVVRSFTMRFEREAAAHVRAGGHAIVWDGAESARLVVPVPKRGDVHDLGKWAMLDIGRWGYSVVRRGPMKGLAFMRVPEDAIDIVRERVDRDSSIAGSTTAMKLDCLACGACCRANEVVLEARDVARFRRAGRAELARKPYARRERDGRVVLVLRRDKRCQHLGRDNKCDIYAIRPDACSTFPMASEGCLYSREEELGIFEGRG
jgi:Fe-S-cluster containining protein